MHSGLWWDNLTIHEEPSHWLTRYEEEFFLALKLTDLRFDLIRAGFSIQELVGEISKQLIALLHNIWQALIYIRLLHCTFGML
jgi:hypothetical protein